MAALDSPSLSATTAGSIPDCSSVEAWKCRRPWSVISGQPALLVILSTTRAMTVGRCHASTPCRRKTTGSAPSPVRSQFRFAWRGDFGSSTIVSLSMSMLPLCSYEADATGCPSPPGAGGGRASGGLDLLHCCRSLRQPVTLIAHLRLDSALYAPAPTRQPGQSGRPALKGPRRPSLKTLMDLTDVPWIVAAFSWYDGTTRTV